MLGVIEFDNGTRLIVETENVPSSVLNALGNLGHAPARPHGIPEGAEPVSTLHAASYAASMLNDQIEALGKLARLAVDSARPSELEIQATVKFAGDAKIIPFFVSAKGEGGLKLTLKWTTESNTAGIGGT